MRIVAGVETLTGSCAHQCCSCLEEYIYGLGGRFRNPQPRVFLA